ADRRPWQTRSNWQAYPARFLAHRETNYYTSRSRAGSNSIGLRSVFDRSRARRGLFAGGDFCEGLGVGCAPFRHGLAIYELALAAAIDQAGFVQDFEVMGNRRGGHSAHRDDLPAAHVAAGSDGL